MPNKINNLTQWLKQYWLYYGNNKKAFFYKSNFSNILEQVLLSSNIPFCKEEPSDSSKQDYINFICKDNIIGFSSLPKENILLGNYKKYGRDDLDIFIFKDYYSSDLQSFLTGSHCAVSDCSDEWVAREQERCQILSSDPLKHKSWLGYTKTQREAILNHFSIFTKNEHKRLFKILP